MHKSPAVNLPSPRGLASGRSYVNFNFEFEFLKNLYFDINEGIYWKIFHLTPVGNLMYHNIYVGKNALNPCGPPT